MATATTRRRTGPSPPAAPPRLRNGDRLTRAEFERRYDAMPELKKAELIEGVVYVPSPVSFDQHGGPHFDVITWLGVYRAGTPGVRGGDNSSLRLDLKNEPQPDAFLGLAPEFGGQSRTDKDGYITGAPELIAEIAASSVSYDLHDKLEVYRRHQVREYVVWRVGDEAIDWFRLRRDRFVRLPLNAVGVYQSRVLPGLWLDVAAMLRGDMAAVLRVAQQGLATPEHAAFVARLKRASRKKRS